MDNHANAARHEAANGTYPAQLFGHVPGTHPKTESQTKLSPTGYHAQSTTQSCHPRDLWLWNLAPERPNSQVDQAPRKPQTHTHASHGRTCRTRGAGGQRRVSLLVTRAGDSDRGRGRPSQAWGWGWAWAWRVDRQSHPRVSLPLISSRLRSSAACPARPRCIRSVPSS